MLGKHNFAPKLYYQLSLDRLVPEDHLLRPFLGKGEHQESGKDSKAVARGSIGSPSGCLWASVFWFSLPAYAAQKDQNLSLSPMIPSTCHFGNSPSHNGTHSGLPKSMRKGLAANLSGVTFCKIQVIAISGLMASWTGRWVRVELPRERELTVVLAA